MGHPRKARKKYDTPPHPWNAERIKTENKLMSKYGLKNKKEIWKADTLVRKYSREARYLLGFSQDQVKVETEELLGHLKRSGILDENAHLENILDLTVEDILRIFSLRLDEREVYKNIRLEYKIGIAETFRENQTARKLLSEAIKNKKEFESQII